MSPRPLLEWIAGATMVGGAVAVAPTNWRDVIGAFAGAFAAILTQRAMVKRAINNEMSAHHLALTRTLKKEVARHIRTCPAIERTKRKRKST